MENEKISDALTEQLQPVEESNEEQLNEAETFKRPARNNKGKVRLVVACVFFSIALVVGVAAALFLGSVDSTLLGGGVDSLGEAIGFIFVIIIAVAAAIAALVTSVLSFIFSAVAIKHSKIAAMVFLIIIGVLFVLNLVFFIILMASGKSSSPPSETQDSVSAMVAFFNAL